MDGAKGHPLVKREELTGFFTFINNRQRIWYRKEVLKKPRPWTKDPILDTAFFTNMYRELDPGTRYVETMLDAFAGGAGELYEEDLAFWILFYRYTGSNWRGWKEHRLLHEFRMPPKQFSAPVAAGLLDRIPTPFGQAYTVFPMTNVKTGKRKTLQVSEGFAEIAVRWPGLWTKIALAGKTDAPDSPAKACALISSARSGVAKFTSYQTWLDYCMLGLLPDWRNEWVLPGPGAIRGASIIWDEQLSPKAAAGACEWLFGNQEEHLDYSKPWWLDHPLYLSDIQNALCEYSKMVRVRDEGRILRKYVAPNLRSSRPKR